MPDRLGTQPQPCFMAPGTRTISMPRNLCAPEQGTSSVKIFLLLYAGTSIIGIWGPIDAMDNCLSQREERSAAIAAMVASGIGEDGSQLPADIVQEMAGWSMSCEQHYRRPDLLGEISDSRLSRGE